MESQLFARGRANIFLYLESATPAFFSMSSSWFMPLSTSRQSWVTMNDLANAFGAIMFVLVTLQGFSSIWISNEVFILLLGLLKEWHQYHILCNILSSLNDCINAWRFRIPDAKPSSNFEHNLGYGSGSMDTPSTKLQPHENLFEELAKCSETPTGLYAGLIICHTPVHTESPWSSTRGGQPKKTYIKTDKCYDTSSILPFDIHSKHIYMKLVCRLCNISKRMQRFTGRIRAI